MTELLSPHARRVAEQVLDEEGAHRRHLVVALSGAHAYGFPSPDSDLDLKGIHVEPTERLLGLAAPPLAASRIEVLEGVEIERSFGLLEEARDRSPLPEEPANRHALEAWLIALRARMLNKYP